MSRHSLLDHLAGALGEGPVPPEDPRMERLLLGLAAELAHDPTVSGSTEEAEPDPLLLASLADDLLPPDERARLEEGLVDKPAVLLQLAELREALQAVDADLASQETTPPATIAANEAPATVITLSSRRRSWLPAVASLAALLLVGVFVVRSPQPIDSGPIGLRVLEAQGEKTKLRSSPSFTSGEVLELAVEVDEGDSWAIVGSASRSGTSPVRLWVIEGSKQATRQTESGIVHDEQVVGPPGRRAYIAVSRPGTLEGLSDRVASWQAALREDSRHPERFAEDLEALVQEAALEEGWRSSALLRVNVVEPDL